jgi:hypothetical protein
MERNREGQQEKEAPMQNQGEEAAVPDLAMTLQAMSLMDPDLCRVQSNQAVQQDEFDFSFCLIMKVDCTGGT